MKVGRPPLLSPGAVVWIGSECEAISNRFSRMAAYRKAYAKARKRAGQNAVENLRLHQAVLASFEMSKRQLRKRKDGTSEPPSSC